MNKNKLFSKMWFLVLLLVTFVAGCASNGAETPPLVPDTIAPTVSFTLPANGAVAVPTNRKVSVAFSEAMDPATITTTSFTLTDASLTAIKGSVATSGSSSVFTPTTPLTPGITYTATVKAGVKDLAGNSLASNYVWSFTTGAVADSIAPTVTITSPTNTSPTVPVNRKIGIAFSEAMDPLTLTTATILLKGPGTTPVSGTVSSANASTLFTPVSKLANNTLYTVTVTNGVKDLAGNPMASNYVFTFTTAATLVIDSIAPTVTVTSPTNTAVAVPVNRKINVSFSESMDSLTITPLTFLMKGPGGISIAGTVSAIGTSATFIPASNLANSTLYTVTVTNGVKDLADNAMANNYVFSFTTGAALDTTKPTVISTTNANGATNVPTNTKAGAVFSEAMDSTTITNQTFTLKQGATNVSGTVTYSGVNAVFTPTNILAANTVYTGTITTGAEDLAGNALLNNYVWSWTTAAAVDTTRPTVTLVNPADLATNVAINSAVHATFSKAMDPLTINTASFTLKNGVNQVTGLVVYDAISKIATFTPSSNLATSTTYTATVTTESADLAGNTLLNDKVWSFTTAALIVPPIEPPASHLGTASANGIMATSTITSTGPSVINGDVAMEPGTEMVGFPPATVNGTIHLNDSVSHQAYADLLVAYNYYKNLPPGVTITAGADLGALYPLGIPPGTYTSGTTMAINTHLTLDGGGDANAVWVFQIGSSITTTTPLGTISLINGANANNVFWVPTASATIGVGTTFYGTVIAGVSITGQTGALINGRLLAGAIGAGTIALDSNVVNVP